MATIAHLKPHSSIAKKWRGEARVGGVLHGAHFIWQFGNNYTTGPLTDEQIILLGGHDNVELERVDEPPSQPLADVLEPRTELSEAEGPGKDGEPPATAPRPLADVLEPPAPVEEPAAVSQPAVIARPRPPLRR